MKATLDALDERLRRLIAQPCGRAARIACAALVLLGFAGVMMTRSLALGHHAATAAMMCLPLAAMLVFAMRIAREHEQGALGALLCVGMLCKLLYVPGGTYGCTVQQYGSLAFYFATCHELPQAIFELVRGSVSEQTLLTGLAMGCIGLCGLAAMLTTAPRSNPTKKDKAD